MEKKWPLLTLMVTGPVEETVPGASVAVAWLVTLLNSRIEPVPKPSAAGATSPPFSVMARSALSATVMLPEPDLVP
jgi:hypothetical protein